MAGFFAQPLRHWRRYLPALVLLAAAIALIFVTGLHRHVSFDVLALRYADLADAVAEAPVLSALLAVLFYAAIVIFFIPGVWLLSIAYGLVFGWLVAIPLVIAGATFGASGLYWAARTAFSDYFRRRAGPMLSRLAVGFRNNAASYLLFLRFAPLFPFGIVNVAPAVLGVSFKTFLWTTFVGITPATIAYAYAGEGLRGIVADRAEACRQDLPPCGEMPSPLDFLAPQIFIAFAVLAVASLLPVLAQYLRSR